MKSIIAVGVSRGELRWPYDKSFSPEKIREFQSYLKGKAVKKCEYLDEVYSELEALSSSGTDEAEIVGAYADGCVTFAVTEALKFGITSYVPDHLIFNSGFITKGVPTSKSMKKCVSDDIQEKGYGLRFDYSFTNGVHVFKPKK